MLSTLVYIEYNSSMLQQESGPNRQPDMIYYDHDGYGAELRRVVGAKIFGRRDLAKPAAIT